MQSCQDLSSEHGHPCCQHCKLLLGPLAASLQGRPGNKDSDLRASVMPTCMECALSARPLAV
eukprot:6479870-Amphidinium_carterae.1